MTQSIHELIAAKAARLRELAARAADADGAAKDADADRGAVAGPSWASGWDN
jgi:hypothetical protein